MTVDFADGRGFTPAPSAFSVVIRPRHSLCPLCSLWQRLAEAPQWWSRAHQARSYFPAFPVMKLTIASRTESPSLEIFSPMLPWSCPLISWIVTCAFPAAFSAAAK